MEEIVPTQKDLGVTFKKPSLTDFTRMGLKFYHLMENPEVAKLIKVEGKLSKDKDGMVYLPVRIHESIVQDCLAPFILNGTLVIPEERSKPCPKVPGKRTLKALPSKKLVSKNRKKK